MAKDVTHNPWVFDATTQEEGSTATSTGVFNCKPYVDFIVAKSNGTAGEFIVLDDASGNTLMDVDTTGTQEAIIFPVGKYVDGIYIQALPSSAKIYVFHGREA